jgi:hypothetical protein
MQTDSDLYSPLYTYNGPANLQELERANLTGARIFFNGSCSLRDLRNVNFMGRYHLHQRSTDGNLLLALP